VGWGEEEGVSSSSVDNIDSAAFSNLFSISSSESADVELFPLIGIISIFSSVILSCSVL
jgi:hypothetical protein